MSFKNRRDSYDIEILPHPYLYTLKDGVITIMMEQDRIVCVNFLCPCGCGSECYTPIAPPQNNRRWDATLIDNKLTLSPSIQYTGGCKSHFNIEDNNVKWHQS